MPWRTAPAWPDRPPDGAGLAGKPAAAHGADDVVLTFAFGRHQRLLQNHLENRAGEVGDMVLAVDGDLARTPLHPDAGDSVLALAGGIGAALGVDFLLIDTGRGRARFGLQWSKIFKRHGLAHGVTRSWHSWR